MKIIVARELKPFYIILDEDYFTRAKEMCEDLKTKFFILISPEGQLFTIIIEHQRYSLSNTDIWNKTNSISQKRKFCAFSHWTKITFWIKNSIDHIPNASTFDVHFSIRT